MEVSFLLSLDELYTLIALTPEVSKAGRRFCDEALSGAEICDLSGLVEKKLAHRMEDELVIEPVLRMVCGAISKADSAEVNGEAWSICSPWVALQCEKYAYHEDHWKITPVKEADS